MRSTLFLRIARLGRLAHLANLPETRKLAISAATSPKLRETAQLSRRDRARLIRDLRVPPDPIGRIRGAMRHPAAHELATAGLTFLPWRYAPLGWAAVWATRKVLKRYSDPGTDSIAARPGPSG